ncbi:tyrosine-type recombinase/integrase [Desulfomonile tiedjei]|uniref:Site-specific recombinase XerD n=1 Tax=Desulfomonile tiedjei (strain ATCC 49306 / DSM 6799 / DCB-1) TaxID=706587 RepID=I4C8X9_DESTA|nr:site-specific integrase [Desulfomonile tiedjei]AFM26020.1 site-specific recombinase XerD [Desulfomonile tiedjei DSM 6799]
MVKDRDGSLFIYFYPFGGKKKVGIKLPTVKRKKEAERIEMAILVAIRSGDYSGLDAVSREACIRMFKNQNLAIPPDLGGDELKEDLTYRDACKIFITDPGIHDSPGRWRHELSLANIGAKIGVNRPIKSVWIPELEQYQRDRLTDKVSPATVNRELVSLSKLFSVLIKHRLIEVNPVRLLDSLSARDGERQVYISFKDVQSIIARTPEWFRPLALTAYYTGMRRGEILGLTKKQVNLSKRIIVLAPQNTKEAHWKRVPIHKDLVPILESSLENGKRKVTSLSNKLFLFYDKTGPRPLELETFKNVWPRACEALGLKEPWPRFHDLRHTWRTNARRSKMDPQIAESILGHQTKARSVSERYGRISDEELVNAIDQMTFDHGETEILVANDVAGLSSKSSNSVVTGKQSKEKKATLHRDPVLMISSS